MAAILVAAVAEGKPADQEVDRFGISVKDINEEAEKQMIRRVSLMLYSLDILCFYYIQECNFTDKTKK